MLVGSNQGNYFENATACSKSTLKTTVATQLYSLTEVDQNVEKNSEDIKFYSALRLKELELLFVLKVRKKIVK